jgi:chromosome partitioning protein
VQKFLVASQRDGVGKTTTSMNLAAGAALAGVRVLLLDADPLGSVSSALRLQEQPGRYDFREHDIDLPGVLVTDVVPGLDVLSPYAGDGCADEELEKLLVLLKQGGLLADVYGCLIVDTPPFLGANPGQLLATCDEYLIVMRAEALAARTLPVLQELIRRSPGGQAIRMRGILLTLPEDEEPGCHLERELRGRLGARILPPVIPHDPEVGLALADGLPVVQVREDAPAAEAYLTLVQYLQLSEGSPKAAQPLDRIALFVRAAAELPAAPVVLPAPQAPAYQEPPRRLAPVTRKFAPSSLPASPSAPQKLTPVPRTKRPAATPPAIPNDPPPRALPARPVVARNSLFLLPFDRKSTGGSANRPPRLRKRRNSGSLPRSPSAQAQEPPAATAAPTVPLSAVEPASQRPPLWVVWVILGAGLGFFFRFVQLPASFIPIVVGAAVAAGVVVALRLIQTGNTASGPAAAPQDGYASPYGHAGAVPWDDQTYRAVR